VYIIAAILIAATFGFHTCFERHNFKIWLFLSGFHCILKLKALMFTYTQITTPTGSIVMQYRRKCIIWGLEFSGQKYQPVSHFKQFGNIG